MPESYFLSCNLARAGQSRGPANDTQARYRAAFVAMLVLNLAAPTLGTAESALKALVDNLHKRGNGAGCHPLPAVTRVDSSAVHVAIAQATLAIDTTPADVAGCCRDTATTSRE